MLNSDVQCMYSQLSVCLQRHDGKLLSFIILKVNGSLISLNQEQNIFLFIPLAEESSTFLSPHLPMQRLNFYVGTADPFLSANLLNYLPFLPVEGRLWFL